MRVLRRASSPTESLGGVMRGDWLTRSEEHTSELQSHLNLVCRLLLEKKKDKCTAPPEMTECLAAVTDRERRVIVHPGPGVRRRRAPGQRIRRQRGDRIVGATCPDRTR